MIYLLSRFGNFLKGIPTNNKGRIARLIHMAKNSKQGFTILELIVVIIIVGVLSGLAVPRMMGTIEKSRRMEAFENFSEIRHAMNTCALRNGGLYVECRLNTAGPLENSIAIDDPSDIPGSHFDYTASGLPAWISNTFGLPEAVDSAFAIVARRNSFDNGDNSSEIYYIYFGKEISGHIGVYIRGSGIFEDIMIN